MTFEEIEAEVSAQSDKFERELTALLVNYRDKWVVYLDGVQGAFDTEREAYKHAMTTYGLSRGPVVAKVERKPPKLLHAIYAFRTG